MSRNVINRKVFLGLLSSAVLFSGCSIPENTEIPPILQYGGTSHRQHAPEPVYSRTRWGLIPYGAPMKSRYKKPAPLIVPIFSFELDQGTLRDAASMLAGATQYSSYCSSTVADFELSLNQVGTIEELASSIEDLAQIRVVVDHINKEIRFLARNDD